MAVIDIHKDNLEELKGGDKPLLLDFYADWCGPCRMVSPLVDEIAEEREDVVVGKVNVDREPELAAQFGVFSIPTLVVQGGQGCQPGNRCPAEGCDPCTLKGLIRAAGAYPKAECRHARPRPAPRRQSISACD